MLKWLAWKYYFIKINFTFFLLLVTAINLHMWFTYVKHVGNICLVWKVAEHLPTYRICGDPGASGTHRSRLPRHFFHTGGSHGRHLCSTLISSTWKPYSKFHNLWPEWASFWFSLCSTQCHLKEGSGRWNCLCLVMNARLLFESFKQPRKSWAFIVCRETYYSYLKYVVGYKILLKYRLVSTKERHGECHFVKFSLGSG